MSYSSTGVSLSGQFSLHNGNPLDSRFVITSSDELNAMREDNALYPGLTFTVTDENVLDGIGIYRVAPDDGTTIVKIADENGAPIDTFPGISIGDSSLDSNKSIKFSAGNNVTIDSSSDENTSTITFNSSDTKNTAGARPALGSSICLVGVKSTGSESAQTFASEQVYVNASGILYSGDPVMRTRNEETGESVPRIDTVITTAQKNAAGGVAGLNSSGKLDNSVLPDNINDVIVGNLQNESEFEEAVTGTIYGNSNNTTSGSKIYLDSDDALIYRWDKDQQKFVQLSESKYPLTVVTSNSTETTTTPSEDNGVYLNEVFNSQVVRYHKIVGANGVTVTAEKENEQTQNSIITITSPSLSWGSF